MLKTLMLLCVLAVGWALLINAVLNTVAPVSAVPF